MNTEHKHPQTNAGAGRFGWGLLAAIGAGIYSALDVIQPGSA